jgi:hypothetical protein
MELKNIVSQPRTISRGCGTLYLVSQGELFHDESESVLTFPVTFTYRQYLPLKPNCIIEAVTVSFLAANIRGASAARPDGLVLLMGKGISGVRR